MAKFRHELKYICSEAQLRMLEVRLACVMRRDSHADERGGYFIRSIYLDDLYDRCCQENEDGVSPREKWRIRTYNCSADRISLECKRKECGMILKTSCLLTREQTDSIIQGKTLEIGRDNPALLNRFILLQKTTGMQPKVIVQYHRQPFICPEGNVRVTFDRNIASSPAIDRFYDPQIPERPVLMAGMQLLEVKYDEFLPDYIYHAIQMTNMRQETFSKYYLCRRYSLPDRLYENPIPAKSQRSI